MAEFEQAREQLGKARGAAEAAEDRVRRARERVRLLGREAASELEAAENDLGRLRGAAEELFEGFERFTDPREQIGRLQDAFPLLLLPLRLETRFKTLSGPGRKERHELWVRVYPDACAIDTFESTLSDGDVRVAREYWQGLWRAGGFEEDERAAWRNLVASIGSGRGRWVLDRYRPLNEEDAPAKAAREDVALVIGTDSPPSPAERAALGTYWRRSWLAGGGLAAEEAALADLEEDVGAARAGELIEEFRPYNFSDRPPQGKKRSDLEVAVAWLLFPAEVETKPEAWTQAPRTRVLPDRFVLIARSGSDRVERVGEPVRSPLVVGPDPSAPAKDQLRPEGEEMAVPDELLWMTDFDRAVEWGLGFRLELTAAQARDGFDQLLVVGVRMSAGEDEGGELLEELIDHHHHGRGGFELIGQGTPTNNTEAAGAGFTRGDDPDAAFDQAPAAEPTQDPLRKRDGQWLAELLGIDPAVLADVPGSEGTDQSEARAMQRALWPATLGYFMETMMRPAFSDATVEQARRFFTRYVSGRGALPAIRIGAQPYGILPTTAFSRIGWLKGERTRRPSAELAFLARLHRLLRQIDEDWSALAASSAHVGGAGDPHQTLLEILGLHPASAEYHYRYAQSLDHLYNHLSLLGAGGKLLKAIDRAGLERQAGELLERLGYEGDAPPEILELYFRSSQGALLGDVVDDRPLSESEEVRDWTGDGRNYLEWLRDAARDSLEALRLQAGFAEGKPPAALLYLLLRHALVLGYADAGYDLYNREELGAEAQLVALKSEPHFVHVADAPETESRWAPLYAAEARITGDEGITVAEHIVSLLQSGDGAERLAEQIEALELLAPVPTARLERLLAEHVDTCSYRFDAWQLGLVRFQLEAMRQGEGEAAEARRGVYLGAYAWLEDLRPKQGPASSGFVHAPSQNQAVTAAVLRSGHEANGDGLAVNLSSERVRLALSVLEGIRAEQSLGALLGYRFERGLHDRHGLAEVDSFVFALRREFPLRADHLQPTQAGPEESIEAIEARNVVDGLRLVEHVNASGKRNYPFGLKLPTADPAQRTAIDAELERLLDVHDAVADLALAEGVHQAVQGNFDRAAGTLDAYSKGSFPPEPEVVRTPAAGFALTHRVGLHLRAGLAAPVGATPRAAAEPALDSWLRGVLPPLASIACTVSWSDPVSGAPDSREVSMDDLGLQPLDLLYLVGGSSDQAMTELDDRVVREVLAKENLRPDTELEIAYVDPPAEADLGVFEVAPLVVRLRSLLLRARPLRPGDVTLPSEGEQRRDELVFAERSRVEGARDDLDDLVKEVGEYLAPLETLLEDPKANRAALLAGVDGFLDDAAELSERAARFGVSGAGWGHLYEWRRSRYAEVVALLRERVERWNGRLAEFAPLLADYDALPGGTPEEELLELLRRAEALVATVLTPAPVEPAALRAALPGRAQSFGEARDALDAIADGGAETLAGLLGAVNALLPLSEFDPEPLAIEEVEKQALSFAAELAAMVSSLAAELKTRRDACDQQLGVHAAAAGSAPRAEALSAAAQAIFGEDFKIVPEFALAPGQGAELSDAIEASTGGELLRYLEEETEVELPVDEWLHGVARVRDQISAWEQSTLLAGAFGRPEPQLTPIQLPYRPEDRWLGLQFPDDYKLDRDLLLYTASFAAPFDPAARQCGLLIDEWTEVIPNTELDTGIAFNYDRPSSEAPQSLLLVTPATADGQWEWEDLVGAVEETLELAKKRTVEPAQIDETAYARFLPATVMAATLRGISIAAVLAINNGVFDFMEAHDDG